MHALVVDDSSAMRVILQKTLMKLGFEVVTSANGIEALSMMPKLDLDLVLIDWNMPVMDGFELLQLIRQEPKYNSVKIIMVTTETNVNEMAHALSVGANEYIMKPFTADVVCAKLRMVGLQSPQCGKVQCT